MSHIALSLEAAQQRGSLSEGLLNNRNSYNVYQKRKGKNATQKISKGLLACPLKSIMVIR